MNYQSGDEIVCKITFVFMHLADIFIQSDIHDLHFDQFLHSLNENPVAEQVFCIKHP